MKMYTQTEYDIQKQANQIKELLLGRLEEDGVDIDSVRLCRTYSIVVGKKGWLGTLVNKVLGWDDDDGVYFAVVKVLPHEREIEFADTIE